MRLALALLALAALTACGERKPAASAADVAPATTYALIEGRPNPRLDRALAFLPEAGEVRRLVARAVAATGAGPAPTLAVLDERGTQVVALTRNDVGDLRLPHARVRGWTVFSRSRSAVDAVRAAKARAAWARPRRGDLVVVRRRVSVTAADEGDHVVATRTEPPEGADRRHPLAASIPRDAVVAAAFHDGASVFEGLPFAGRLRSGLGVDVSTLAAAAPGDAVLYARRGEPAAAVTLIARGSRLARIRALVRELAPNAPPPLAGAVDGVPAADVALGPVDLLYGTTARSLFLTDDPGATIRPVADPLAPPGLPAQTRGWGFLDVPDGLPALESLAALAGTRLSPAFRRKTAGLKALLVYRTRGALSVEAR